MSVQLAAGSMAKASTPEPVGSGPLWKTPGLHLPAYIQHVANELIKQGHDESRAIQMAVGIIKNWASGTPSGGEKGLQATTIAAAQKALAEWEAAKATARAYKASDEQPAVELAWNGAKHPRKAAGAAGGGQFAAGGEAQSGASANGAGAKPGVNAEANKEAARLLDQLRGMTPAQRVQLVHSLSGAQLQALGGWLHRNPQTDESGKWAAQAILPVLAGHGLGPDGVKAGTASAGAHKTAKKPAGGGGGGSGKSSGGGGGGKSSGGGGGGGGSKSSGGSGHKAASKPPATKATAPPKTTATPVSPPVTGHNPSKPVPHPTGQSPVGPPPPLNTPESISQRKRVTTMSYIDQAVIELVGPKGYSHGWIKADGSTDHGKLADHLAGSTHGQAKKTVADLADHELAGVDHELGRRAASLGRPGAVSKSHALVKAERAKRAGKAKTMSYIDQAVIEMAGANPFVKKDDASAGPPDSSGGGGIPNVGQLRRAMTDFNHCPGPQRKARLAQIKAAAGRLGAGDLDWVKSFIAVQTKKLGAE